MVKMLDITAICAVMFASQKKAVENASEFEQPIWHSKARKRIYRQRVWRECCGPGLASLRVDVTN